MQTARFHSRPSQSKHTRLRHTHFGFVIVDHRTASSMVEHGFHPFRQPWRHRVMTAQRRQQRSTDASHPARQDSYRAPRWVEIERKYGPSGGGFGRVHCPGRLGGSDGGAGRFGGFGPWCGQWGRRTVRDPLAGRTGGLISHASPLLLGLHLCSGSASLRALFPGCPFVFAVISRVPCAFGPLPPCAAPLNPTTTVPLAASDAGWRAPPLWSW